MLGGNQFNPSKQLEIAIFLIGKEIGEVVKKSNIYETEPWGVDNQPNYLNQAIGVETELLPERVLEKCLAIEKRMGRIRKNQYDPRIIDIDVLLIDDLVRESQKLTLPHPRLHLRNFVLFPLSEIAGEVVHPIFRKEIKKLKEECEDEGEVWLFAK